MGRAAGLDRMTAKVEAPYRCREDERSDQYKSEENGDGLSGNERLPEDASYDLAQPRSVVPARHATTVAATEKHTW